MQQRFTILRCQIFCHSFVMPEYGRQCLQQLLAPANQGQGIRPSIDRRRLLLDKTSHFQCIYDRDHGGPFNPNGPCERELGEAEIWSDKGQDT